jgi:putative hydrolase of the HAD superfamily
VDPEGAVGFDLGDTLCEYAGVPLNWESEYPAALASLARQCGLELTDEALGAGARVLSKYNTRRTPREDLREFTAQHVFGELLAAWDAPARHVDASIAAFFGHFRQNLRAFPESAHVLRQLDAHGIGVGILTDVPYGMPRSFVSAELELTDLPIADARVITSVDVGRRKPHTEGFAALAAVLGVPCNRMTYVGNERKDIAGGTAAGCRTVLVWRSIHEAPDWGQTWTVRTLDELLDLPNVPDEA